MESTRRPFLILVVALLCLPVLLLAQGQKPLTYQDLMQFKSIKNPAISADGGWIAYAAEPDRGDGEAHFHALQSEHIFTIERGSRPVFAGNSRWAAVTVKPAALALERAKKDKPKQGMALIDLQSGEVTSFNEVERFAFAEDGQWLAYQHYQAKKKPAAADTAAAPDSAKAKEKKPSYTTGATLKLRKLDSGQEFELANVLAFAFDSTSTYLAYAVGDSDGGGNGLFLRDLRNPGAAPLTVLAGTAGHYTELTWNRKTGALAFLAAQQDDKGKPGPASLHIWDARGTQVRQVASTASAPEGWILPAKNQLTWSLDGERLFFGMRPQRADEKEASNGTNNDTPDSTTFFDIDAILKKREVDVWHWDDPLINSHQKKEWKDFKDQTYRAVYWRKSGRITRLADEEMPDLIVTENAATALGVSNVPYRKEITWAGPYVDGYAVDLQTGTRKKIAGKLYGRPISLSPGGRFAVYYDDRHWHLYDIRSGATRNLTASLNVPFANEDHDYPYPAPGYGVGGWVAGDAAVLIYDKYDIWQFATRDGQARNLTAGDGRKNELTFRIRQLDRKQQAFTADQSLLLTAYHNLEKHDAVYRGQIGGSGVTRLYEQPKKLQLLARADNADVVLFTREDYNEFPDLWVSDPGFRAPRKITNLGEQIDDFAWGSAELVSWRSLDGLPLQGVLIKPGNYEPGKRYPVLVYFYRFFSQRLYEFNDLVVNHRPSFPMYASNGYAIFLPDIRFEIGRPGFAATKSLVPGVQKLIDMGIADPKAIGLHGHSWSGYQAAFIITQTDIFAAAVAGAPVSNMTSAYGGIRWGSGLSRQFQYEATQSRIGGSLWEYPERYIENSPLFFADRINTPLLIQFGDEDEAVPWYQGIELYMAMRRLVKPAVFLQYRGEPHHLQKYANKLDYSIKMKAFFDHYLKGEPAPDWLSEGVPYSGK